MKYKMIERNLAEHGMGIDKISEADELVFLDDQLLVNDILRKDKRSIRIQNAENKKNRNKRLYSMSGDVERYAHRFWYDVDDRVNIAPVFASGNEPVAFIKKSRKNGFKKVVNKVENRKVRYQKIADEPMATYVDEYEEDFETPWFVDKIHRRADAVKNHVIIPEGIKKLIALQEEKINLNIEIDEIIALEVAPLQNRLRAVNKEIQNMYKGKVPGLKLEDYKGWVSSYTLLK